MSLGSQVIKWVQYWSALARIPELQPTIHRSQHGQVRKLHMHCFVPLCNNFHCRCKNCETKGIHGHRRTGPFPWEGGGGAQHFLPESLILDRKTICLGSACLPHMGGGGRRRITLLKWLGIGNHRGGGPSPSHGGDFCGFGGSKTRFWVHYKVEMNINCSSTFI